MSSEPFIGEIRIWGGDYPPRNWAFCNGDLLQIVQYTALYSILGITYGGDGKTTFALPDMRGRIPMHPGSGPGLSTRNLGEQGGVEAVTLTPDHLPMHTHTLMAQSRKSDLSDPTNRVLSRTSGGFVYLPANSLHQEQMHNDSLTEVGGGQAHNNMQPYLALDFIIALVGIYPNRD